jgi:hypothetical protein
MSHTGWLYRIDFVVCVDILFKEVEMLNTAKYQRMLESSVRPTEREIATTLGIRVTKLWKELRTFLKVNFDYTPELTFYGRTYGWCYRYRRKGKTLCVLFPESKAFSVLVVFGKKEITEFSDEKSSFNKDTQYVFKNAYTYHDGKWMYKRVLNKSDLNDVKSLIAIKRKPK